MANQKKKPSSGRPNYEPRYGAGKDGQKRTSYQDGKRRPAPAASKPGSRSAGHRGYRAPEERGTGASAEGSAAPKARWSASQRAGRDEARGIRDHAPRTDRSPRTHDDRPARAHDRSARAQDRPARSYDRSARPGGKYPTNRPQQTRDDRARSRGSDRPREDRPGTRAAAGAAYAAGRSDWNAGSKRPADSATHHHTHVDVVHERLQAQAVQADQVEGTTWQDLGLGQNIVKTLLDLGAESPFPIQAATIPEVLAGRDVLARGRTGSGKTIAFGAPLVERVLKSQAGKRREFGRAPKALILAPTRELALQLDRTIQPIARSVGLFTTQIYGGVPQGRQVGALRKGVDIVIGTPGRIEDLIDQRKLDLSDVMVAVIDEADHMSELGFLEPVQRILRKTAEHSQKLLFSATLDREVAGVVDEFLVDPAVYEVAGETQETGTIEHRILVIDHRDKAVMLDTLVKRDGKTLVFARTRAYAEMLAEQFVDSGIPAVALHGDLNQAKRSRNLERLTSGRVNVLVATDVAARGIHVDDIDLVVQADMPDEYKTYLHRSGRTGRAGATGLVVTLITRQRRRKMTEMLERAEIDAPFEDARPGDHLISTLGRSG